MVTLDNRISFKNAHHVTLKWKKKKKRKKSKPANFIPNTYQSDV